MKYYVPGRFGEEFFKLNNQKKKTPNVYSLDFFLSQINIKEYYIYKSTRKQREITIEELLLEKYSAYIFFKKDTYSNIEINSWLEFLISNKIGILFLHNPLPPNYIKQKIETI